MNNEIMTEKRNDSFSLLRSVACLGILVLHTVYINYQAYFDTLSINQRFSSELISAWLMWPVPLFVMISGALLLNPKKEISIGKIYKKYIFRMIAVLVVFSLVFALVDSLWSSDGFDFSFIRIGLLNCIQGSSWSHLWYIYLLIGLYVILPVIRRFVQSATEQEIRYFIFVCSIFFGGTQILQLLGVTLGFYIHFSTIYPCYFVMGYAIYNGILSIDAKKGIILVVGSTFVILSLVYLQIYQGVNVSLLWSYPSIVVALQTAGVFALGIQLKNIRSFWVKIDPYTFGIYLIHLIFVRYALYQMGINPYTNILAFILIIVGSGILSFLVTWVLKRIPFLGKVL